VIIEIIKNKKAKADESVFALHGTTCLKRKAISKTELLQGTTPTTGGFRKLIPTEIPFYYIDYRPIYPRALLHGGGGVHTTSIRKWGVVAVVPCSEVI
jgi:hypothetical protein